MQTYESIGGKITEARKRTGLSQAQLAERLSISPQAVGKWERGESMPDIVTFDRLAALLGVDMNYFSSAPEGARGAFPIAPAQSGSAAGEPPRGPNEGPRWDMSQGNWQNSDFSGLKNLGEKFSSSNIKNCDFSGSELSGLILKYNNIEASDFSKSDLSGGDIKSSNVLGCSFKECDLKGAKFSGSNIKRCDFTSADLTGASFHSSALSGIKTEGAVWERVSFRSSQFSGMTIGGRISGCSFENCAFSKLTFEKAAFSNTFFKGKPLRKIKFVDCTADRLTYAFLKNGKAELSGVKLIDEA